MPRFQVVRDQLLAKLRPILVDPVAELLVVAYEPRQDGEVAPKAFSDIIASTQNRLKLELPGLTANNGGKIESLALQYARELHAAATNFGISGSARLLECAITRRGEVRLITASVHSMPLDVERVQGPSGRPIGLWR